MTVQPPKSLTRAEFYQLIEETGEVPKLYDCVADLYQKEGLRAVSSGLLPKEVDVWMWPDKLCLVSIPMFQEMKKALEALGG